MGSSSDFKGCITHGPWGGYEGNKWVYMPQGLTKKIKIMVRYGLVVDSIEFQTYCSHCNNNEGQSSFFGGNGGKPTNMICLYSPTEYIMSISGTTGAFDGLNVVKSICFMTNLKLYGPYGTNAGTDFSYDVKDGVIAGFHGRAGKYLTAIGVYAMPKSLALGPNFKYEGKIQNELCSGISRIAMSRDAGPWGADGGKPWDDGVFSTIKMIRVHLGNLNVIYAFQFEYLKSDGSSGFTQIHGDANGYKLELGIDFDVSKGEYLTGISGFYGPVEDYNGLEAIVSISFHTNKGTHGPYGEETGAGYVYFSSTASPGKVVGFHGRNNGFLSAIGVHMEYF